MKHPHHDVIVAWAANTKTQIQWRSKDTENWATLGEIAKGTSPMWHPHWQYRIKPEPVVYYINCNRLNYIGFGQTGIPVCPQGQATHELTYEDGKFVSLKEINK